MQRLIVLLVLSSYAAFSQTQPFRFAFISDTHISAPNANPHVDLSRTVRDINAMSDIAFVVLTGDITELGTDLELNLAKQILDSLDIPYHIIPGNHDTGWSESGGLGFTKVFGDDKFVFDYNGIRFVGCASGPYVRMSDGHVPRSNLIWMDSVLKSTPKEQPLIFLNHYPINDQLDNWYEITDRLRQYHTIAILCGHGHRNVALDFEGIPATMGRSNLRARQSIGGYNLVDMTADSIIFSERRPGMETRSPWRKIKIQPRIASDTTYRRPQYDVNASHPNVKATWTFSSPANVISTPAVASNNVIFGNQDGVIQSLSLLDGSKKWSVQTRGPIFSSPAVSGKNVVVGSADGFVYCVNASDGTVRWKVKTDGPVLGSPFVEKGLVYVGGSDGHFRCLNAKTGRELWRFTGVDGPIVSSAVTDKDKLIFGAWDTNLYCLNKTNGALLWKWNNGSPVRNYSPASCIPVIENGVVYIVAPDRYISAIDIKNGKTLWRSKDGGVRESIGISEDGTLIYGKSMQDTIVAYSASRERQTAKWKIHCGFGYEHVPSMLIEKDGQLFFGTKNGVVYAIDPTSRKILWRHKIDNSMVNTVRVLSTKKLIVSTMDGKVELIEVGPGGGVAR